MSDIRFNRWLHQSGTGGVYQDSSGNIGIGTSTPSTALEVVGVVTATSFSGDLSGNVTGNVTGDVTGNLTGNATGLSGSPTLSGITSVSTTNLTVNGNAYPNAGPLSNRNIIINGAMMVDQRNNGASVSPSGTYTYHLDRYATWYSTGSGHTIQQVADAPVGFQYSWKFTTGTGATPTANQYGRMAYLVEGYDANVLELGTANQPAFTFSFYAKISVAGTYGVQFYSANATTKYQASFAIASGETGTWVRRVITVPAGTMVDGTYGTTNGTAFTIAFDLGEGSSRSVATGYHSSAFGGALGLTGGTKIMSTSGATYQLTGLQLEVGSQATPFEHRSYGDELQRCERYYEVIYGATGIAMGYSYATTAADTFIRFKTKKRAAPGSVTLAPAGQSSGQMSFLTNNGGYPTTTGSHTVSQFTTDQCRLLGTGYTGLSGSGASLLYVVGVTDVFRIDAEL